MLAVADAIRVPSHGCSVASGVMHWKFGLGWQRSGVLLVTVFRDGEKVERPRILPSIYAS